MMTGGEMAAIPGLIYLPNFITEEEEKEFVSIIDSHPFCHVMHRRQQFYGKLTYFKMNCGITITTQVCTIFKPIIY